MPTTVQNTDPPVSVRRPLPPWLTGDVAAIVEELRRDIAAIGRESALAQVLFRINIFRTSERADAEKLRLITAIVEAVEVVSEWQR